MTTIAEDETKYPVLEAAPGMTMAEAAAASTVPFRVPADTEEPCVAQPHVPHRFRLRDPARGFDAPAGLFSVLEATRGVIFRLRATPHVGYITQTEAIALFEELSEAIESKRWLRRLRRDPGSLAARLAEGGEDKAGDWLGDEWVCELWIRRAVEANSEAGRVMQLEDDAYLMTLILWDIRRTAERMG